MLWVEKTMIGKIMKDNVWQNHETGYVICVVVLTSYLEEVNSFGTCKCISQLLKRDATLVPAVKEDWHQTQHHILHKHQKEEEGLGDRRRSKKLLICGIFSPG